MISRKTCISELRWLFFFQYLYMYFDVSMTNIHNTSKEFTYFRIRQKCDFSSDINYFIKNITCPAETLLNMRITGNTDTASLRGLFPLKFIIYNSISRNSIILHIF